jgi:hypothetical protein
MSCPAPQGQVGIYKGRKNEMFHSCMDLNFDPLADCVNAYLQNLYWMNYRGSAGYFSFHARKSSGESAKVKSMKTGRPSIRVDAGVELVLEPRGPRQAVAAHRLPSNVIRRHARTHDQT